VTSYETEMGRTSAEDNLLKVKVCTLYYRHHLSKVEIGRNLRISRFRVARLIEDAVLDGTVTIDIREPENTFTELENTLENEYGILRACIVGAAGSYDQTRIRLGAAAAGCFVDFVHDGDTIGIAWGTTIHEMVNALPTKLDRRDVTVVQLTGGLNQVESKYNAIELSSRLAEIFDSTCYHLFAPAIVDNSETKEKLLNDSNIKRTLDMFNRVDVAIVGIGSVSPEPSSLLYKAGILSDEYVNRLLTNSAAGDINTCFYDDNGKNCGSDLEDRAVGMNIDQLKKVKYVMGIAGGDFKVRAIKAALSGRIVNILVTDDKTASSLLEQ
jgi:deoxyribonucleoside regulator